MRVWPWAFTPPPSAASPRSLPFSPCTRSSMSTRRAVRGDSPSDAADPR
eukprot:gene44192-62208_t